MQLIRPAAIIVLLLWLAGCAVTREEALQARKAAEFCCEVMSQFPFQRLAPGEPVSLWVDETAPLNTFGGGRSFFRAFQLPA